MRGAYCGDEADAGLTAGFNADGIDFEAGGGRAERGRDGVEMVASVFAAHVSNFATARWRSLLSRKLLSRSASILWRRLRSAARDVSLSCGVGSMHGVSRRRAARIYSLCDEFVSASGEDLTAKAE